MRMSVWAAACIIGQQHRIQRYEIAVADHWSQARSPVRFSRSDLSEISSQHSIAGNLVISTLHAQFRCGHVEFRYGEAMNPSFSRMCWMSGGFSFPLIRLRINHGLV